MKLRSQSFGVCAVAGALLFSAQSAFAAPWKTVAPKGAGFSVSMPGTPKASKTVDKDKDGSITTDYDWTLETDTSLFMVGYQEHPAATARLLNGEALLEEVVKGMMGAKGKILSNKKVTLNGFPGREVKATADEGVLLNAKLYWVKNRLYMVMAGIPKNAVATKHATKFLQSFKLTK
jgi:hypothetical protein